MRITGQTRALAVIATVLAGPAFAQQPAPMQHDMAAMSMSAPGTGGPADKAMTAGMNKMQQDMANAPMTGDPDKDFVATMLPHHLGAVDMAKVEVQYGKDPEMRKLAQSIIVDQTRERVQMLAWQAKHSAK